MTLVTIYFLRVNFLATMLIYKEKDIKTQKNIRDDTSQNSIFKG